MPATRLRIFVSSVQKEFESQRQDLKAFLLGDPVLKRFVSEVFLFEDLPAKDVAADDLYLSEVDRCDIYLGIFGYEYGWQDDAGVSPTEHEFNRASEKGKTRFVYVWGSEESRRDKKMKALVRKASDVLVRRRVEDTPALRTEVYASLVDHLDELGVLKVPPFDTSACDSATLRHLSRKRIDWFLEAARRERGFPLKPNTATKALLTHLNLLDGSRPTNAAVVLFGSDPQKFHRPAETKCVHCHGTNYRRPFASQQIYGGDLFEQVDQARDFVLSKINRSVGTRAGGSTAPATYELPPDAVGEAIVNAVAHRDYNSNGSVEIRLFPDRLEIWNPGSLPGNLTPESLREDHPSLPNNPLIAETLYLARYIEKAGSGTQAMIELCRGAGLPEPDFEQRPGSFVTTLWRDWLTDEVLAGYDLDPRMLAAIQTLKSSPKLTSADYQSVAGVPPKTASRDLKRLVEKGLLVKHGERRGTYYTFKRK